MTENFRVGVITSTHGVRGEVRVFPTTDDPHRFKKLKSVFCDTPSGMKKLEITGVKYFRQMVILKFDGIDSMDEAQTLRQMELYVPREDAQKLGDNEYYIADLIGLSVVDDKGDDIGMVTDVLLTGANDVYEVKDKDGREILIPAIKDCIKEVDVEGGKMTVSLLPGMKD